MPGEFEPHIGCWMLWPERSDNWRNGAKTAQGTFAAVATAIAEGEPVTVCVSRDQYPVARQVLPESIRLVEMSSNDSWIRDCGPTFVVDTKGEVRGIHKIHQPDPLYITEDEARGVNIVPGSKPRRAGDRMPASYVNFYIGQSIVVMPSFSSSDCRSRAEQIDHRVNIGSLVSSKACHLL